MALRLQPVDLFEGMRVAEHPLDGVTGRGAPSYGRNDVFMGFVCLLAFFE